MNAIEKRIVPDDGPSQHDLAEWIRKNGGEAHLYDGCVQNNIETSTNANWRWKYIDIPGNPKWASVGDTVIMKGGKFTIEHA